MVIKVLDNVVCCDSFVMVYNDVFLVLGIVLISCVVIVWLSKKVFGGVGVVEVVY